MLNWRKILLSGCVVVLLFVAACSGANKEPNNAGGEEALANLNASGFPIVNESITLKAFAGTPAQVNPKWDELMLWQEYEKMTNIRMQWDLVSAEVDILTEKRNILLAGGDLPDILFGAAIPEADVTRYGGQGILIPLNDLIDRYAPNIKALMDKYPAFKRALTSPDGNIYALSGIHDPEFVGAIANQKLWVRQDWLEQLDMDIPDTLDEFYEYLVKVKETDLNGNGQHDEIPIMFRGVKHLISGLTGSWGLQNRGEYSSAIGLAGPVDIDPDTGDLRFVYTHPYFKEVLEFANKMYTEGLFDKESFVLTAAQLYAIGGEGNLGAFRGGGPSSFNSDDYVGLAALQGPHGHKLYSSINSPFFSTGNFAITNKNRHPEASIRWVDHFYSEEGNLMYYMGFEGITYRKGADGSYEYTDEILKHPDGLNLNQALGQYLVWPGTGNPSIVMEKTFKGLEGRPESLETAERIRPDMVEEIWPQFRLTPEETEQMYVGTDIGTYIDEMIAKFVSGEVPFSEWDNYVKRVEDMGLAKFMGAFRSAYERYLEIE